MGKVFTARPALFHGLQGSIHHLPIRTLAPIHPCIHSITLHLSNHPFTHLPIHPSFHPSLSHIHSTIHPSIHLSRKYLLRTYYVLGPAPDLKYTTITPLSIMFFQQKYLYCFNWSWHSTFQIIHLNYGRSLCPHSCDLAQELISDQSGQTCGYEQPLPELTLYSFSVGACAHISFAGHVPMSNFSTRTIEIVFTAVATILSLVLGYWVWTSRESKTTPVIYWASFMC